MSIHTASTDFPAQAAASGAPPRRPIAVRTLLPSAFAAVLLAVVLAALAGFYQLNRALDGFGVGVVGAVDLERDVRQMDIDFKEQVQEWKNVLLRGKDAALLDRHWQAFEKKEKAVATNAADLQRRLPDGPSGELLRSFAAEHRTMGEKYRVGLAAFKAAGFDPAAGDAAVSGVDREPSKRLAEVSANIEANAATLTASTLSAGEKAIWFSVGAIGVMTVVGILVSLLVTRSLLRRLGGEPADASDMARSIAGGNLATTVRLRDGDTTSMTAQLQLMQRNLVDVVGGVRRNAEVVASSSSQIAAGNQDLSSRTEEQASALEETAAAMEQLSVTFRQNADSAKEASQLSEQASRVATEGGDIVVKVVDTMREIDGSSRRIAEIISTIDAIAFQTNILALNAAVEAARAGEQGRGFAVVATEVRTLAGRSAEAAKDIRGLIAASVERVAQGTALVDQAGSKMQEVVTAIQNVTSVMGEISAATREQSTGFDQVGQAVAQMDQVTQQNAALVEESAAAADGLMAQSRALLESVAGFVLPGGAAGTGVAAAVPAMRRSVIKGVGARGGAPLALSTR